MPVKYSAFTKASISLSAVEKCYDETPEIKIDNTKEFFNTNSELCLVACTKTGSNYRYPLLLSAFPGFVETPPPNFL